MSNSSIMLLSDGLGKPGTGTYAADLARALGELGHRVMLAVTALTPDDLLLGDNVKIHSRVRLGLWRGGALVREAREFRPDVVHATVASLGRAARRIAHKLGAPSVVTVHAESIDEEEWGHPDVRGSSVIAAGQSVREDLVNNLHVNKSVVTVVYPGVAAPAEAKPGRVINGHTPVVGTLGALQYAEGHRFLLEAARKVLDRSLDLQVMICGSGPEKCNLRNLARKLDLTEILTIVEDTSRSRELMAMMDIFVLPTTREGMGIVVLDAMGLGKPVIVSGVGSVFAAVQHNHTGLDFPKGDSDALATAIIRLMLKPDFAARLATQGQELVRRDFNLDNMVEKTREVYERVAG